jgi:hypothetical protein
MDLASISGTWQFLPFDVLVSRFCLSKELAALRDFAASTQLGDDREGFVG